MDDEIYDKRRLECGHCHSTDLKIKMKIIGQGANRHIQKQLVCNNCGDVIAVM